jgi:integrase
MITLEQSATICAASEGEVKGLIIVAATTGQRIQNIIAIRGEDVDLPGGFFRFHRGIAGRAFPVPIAPQAREWTEQHAFLDTGK